MIVFLRAATRSVSALIPSAIYAALFVSIFWGAPPGLFGFDKSLPARAKLVDYKSAVDQQLVVYLRHDLTVRPLICREYASQLDEDLDKTGQGMDLSTTATTPIVQFARGLATWRKDFCAIPDSAMMHAIAAIRSHSATAVLDNQKVIDQRFWTLLVDSRREPDKSIDWRNADAINIDGAVLRNANLRGAHLRFSSLRGVHFGGTNLAGADFLGADVAGAWYSPDGTGKSSSLPEVGGMAAVANLETIQFQDPAPIFALRAAFKELGYREAERKLTFAIEQRETEQACSGADRDRVICLLRRLFMQWPTGYGMQPSHALQVILVSIMGFSILYLMALVRSSTPRIWRVWSKDRIARDCGSDTPEPLQLSRYAPLWALYFSALSASQIGWKDLTIGNWIARIQPGEYTLQATAWVRTVSGLQAVTTVYLLAIWALTYFGRPFG